MINSEDVVRVEKLKTAFELICEEYPEYRNFKFVELAEIPAATQKQNKTIERPEFTKEQEEWMHAVVDGFYACGELNNTCTPFERSLEKGKAEQLKDLLCGAPHYREVYESLLGLNREKSKNVKVD